MGAVEPIRDEAAEVAGDDVDEVDGRSKRRIRNREAVIQALIDLVGEGHLVPTVSEIAKRAGVSDRSLFRYFVDLRDLAHAAITREITEALPLTRIHQIGRGDLAVRIDRIIHTRLRTYERTHMLGRIAQMHSVRIPEVGEALDAVLVGNRQQIEIHFAPELGALPTEEAERVVLAVLVTMSNESYDLLSRQIGLDPEAVEETWRHALLALLAS